MKFFYYFYVGLQPLLKRQRFLTVVNGSIFLFLLVGDCFTIVTIVKIWLAEVSTPHDATLLLRREELYQITLGV
jgi:hypothetical protein